MKKLFLLALVAGGAVFLSADQLPADIGCVDDHWNPSTYTCTNLVVSGATYFACSSGLCTDAGCYCCKYQVTPYTCTYSGGTVTIQWYDYTGWASGHCVDNGTRCRAGGGGPVIP